MRRNTHSAFTLIELLAATALGAMLMVAVLGVVRSTASQEAAMRQAESEPSIPARVVDLISWDMEHSRRISIGDDRLALEGHGAYRADNLECIHRPTIVVYRLQNTSGRNFLVREQVRRDQLSSRNTWMELVYADVRSFKIEEVKAVEDPRPANTGTSPGSARVYRLVIEMDGAGKPAMAETLILR